MSDSTLQLLVGVALALAVLAFIAWPLLARRAAAPHAAAHAVDPERVERRIGEYRRALRQRTLCDRCLYANPPGSRFCAQCGARLGAADAPGADTPTDRPAP